MNTHIVRVEKKNIVLFEGLDPFGRLKLLDMPESFAIAAIDEDEEDRGIAYGILTGFLNSDRISINWIGVSSSMQACGVGEALLLKVLDMADKENIPVIEALISSKYESESFAMSAGEYFKQHLFEQEKAMPSDFFGVTGELLNLECMKQDKEKLPCPVSLASFSPDQIRSVLDQLDGISEASKLYSFEKEKGHLDHDLSFVFIDGTEAYSALLVRKLPDCLIPVYYFAENEKEGSVLMMYAIEAAVQKYGKDMDVEVLFRSDALCEQMSTVFTGKRDKGKILYASVDDYRARKEPEDFLI